MIFCIIGHLSSVLFATMGGNYFPGKYATLTQRTNTVAGWALATLMVVLVCATMLIIDFLRSSARFGIKSFPQLRQ